MSWQYNDRNDLSKALDSQKYKSPNKYDRHDNLTGRRHLSSRTRVLNPKVGIWSSQNVLLRCSSVKSLFDLFLFCFLSFMINVYDDAVKEKHVSSIFQFNLDTV